MKDFREILEIKKAAQERLLSVPGVHAVGVGAKIVGGKRTSELSITVFVTQKKAESEVPPEQRIPSEINGVKTDVVEMGRVRRMNGLPDKTTYRPLIGGGRIQPGGALGGGGTLGCFAHTTDTPPKIVALTCHHVVAEPNQLATNVSINYDNNKTLTVAVSGPKAIANSEIAVFLNVPSGSQFLHRAAYYMTTGTDTETDIAVNLKKAIDKLALSGVNVTVTGAAVEIDGNSGRIEYQASGPDKPDSKAKLHASISSTDPTTHVITFTGESKDGYGVYAEIDLGGNQAVFGGLTVVDSHFAPSGVASAVASFLQGVIKELKISGVTVSWPPGTNTITVASAEAVRCNVTSDTRVGQPDNRFGCSTSWCTNNRIGRVYKSRADVDTALIILDAGLKYLAEIQNIGVVKGFYEVTDTDVQPGGPGHTPVLYSVKKRGEATGLTPPPDDGCHISHLHMDGHGDLGDFYQEGMLIVSAHDVDAPGDSGSALISAQPPNDGKVVGIIYGGAEGLLGTTWGLATPIKAIMDAMGVDMETATDAQKGVPRTVPKIAGMNMAMLPEEEVEGASVVGHPSAQLRDRLMEVGQEVAATPLGQDYAEAVQRHIPEVQDLVNQHRRVGAIWNRNGGNQIVASFLEIVQFPERKLPAALNDRPITECLRRIQKALARYGSAALAADLARLGPLLIDSCNLTYPEMLGRLKLAGGE
jgi:hypothetical protein